MKFSRHVNFANFAIKKKSRNLSDAKIKCRKNNMTRKLSHSTCMLIIEIATLSPSHTFITIILSYSVVMFWSSLSLLFSVSTPGSTSFVQSSNFLFIWTLLIKKSLIKFRDMLNNIDKETKCLNQKRGIKVSQNAKFFAKSRN